MERKARLASPVNRTRLRAEQTAGRRMRTLLRVARGKYSAMNVLEDVTEDNVVRYMEATGQDLGFFVDNLRELGKAMGNEWQFLRELGEGEQHGMMDVVEGLGKVVRGKVLADTAHKANGLPAWVNTFLDMVRRWVEQAAALMQLGEAVNKYMYADETTREKFAPEFREMVEKVTEQDVEFLRELQQERSKEAEERILRAAATGYAPAAEATPTMDAAEAEHGEAVRQEQEAEEAYRERVDEDVSAALEMTSATNEEGAEEKTLQQQKGELHYVRHGDFESATVTRDPRAEDGSVGESAPREAGAADSEGRGDAGATGEVGRGVHTRDGELRDSLLEGELQGLRRPETRSGLLRLHLLTSKVHRFHADAAQKAREKGIYTGELHELTQSDESAALFRECIEAAKVTQGLQGNCVYTYDVEDYAKMRLFLTPDGKAGLALKQSEEDGCLDMVSVFKDKTLLDRGEKRVDALIMLAIQQGVQKADCYGSRLVELYGKFGFRAVAKDRFNAEYAPDPMKDESVMREAFNREPDAGKPDVVYLVYVGNRESVLDEFDSEYMPDYAETLDYAQGENTYDACVKTQSEAVKQAEKWMRTLPSKEAREAALRKHLQRQSEGRTLSVEEAQKQGLFKDGVMETGNAVITTPAAAELWRGKPDMSSAIEDVQHASPHKFKKFDLEHIGSGEGAQAYGWGVYFSSNWSVNRSYHADFNTLHTDIRNAKGEPLSDEDVEKICKEYNVNAKWLETVTPIKSGLGVSGFSYEERIAGLETHVKGLKESIKEKGLDAYTKELLKNDLAESKTALKALRMLSKEGIYRHSEKKKAMNYLSDLHVEEGELLDWEAALEGIQDKLAGAIEGVRQEYPGADWLILDSIVKVMDAEGAKEELKTIAKYWRSTNSADGVKAAERLLELIEGDFSDAPMREKLGDKYSAEKNGRELYNELRRELGSPQAASEWLLERGIKGIRYEDAASRRSNGKRSYNYVIFDPSVIEVKKVAERKDWSSNVNDTSVWEDYAGWSSSFAVNDMWDEESPLEESVLKEMEDIVAKSKANGTYMKAPNGADTKLSPEQWAIVRTRAFKEWFGDWEKVATFNSGIEKLEKMKPVASITGNEFAQTGKNDLTDRVAEYWQSNYGGKVYSRLLGDVALDKRSAKASIGHGIGRLKSAAFHAVPDVIKNGVLIDHSANWKNRGYDTYVLAAPISISGVEYICETVITKSDNRTGFYLHEVQIKEKLLDVFKTGVNTGTPRALRSIIALNYDAVKDIEKNCSKIVDENGEPLVVYHGTMDEPFSVFDGSKSMKAGESRHTGTAFWFAKQENTAKMYTYFGHGRVMAVFLRAANPKVINAKGKRWDDLEWYGNRGTQNIAEWAKSHGYDAVMFRHIYDHSDFYRKNDLSDVVAVYDSTQIKSVDNRGTFDGGNPDITFAMAYIDEEQITRPLKAAARSFRANEAFVQQMLGEMRQCMNKLRRLSDRTRTDREEALATMGAVVQLVKSVRLYMPRGYRFSVAPYIRQLEGLSELATTGRIHLTQKITEADIKRDAREVRLNGEAANSALETGAYEAEAMADELAREYGDQTLNAVLEEVMSRVADGLREYAKDEVVKRMAKLLERAQVKKDKKTGKLKGGLMDAEGYREMDKVREAVQMDAGALADKLASLEAKAAKDDLTDAQRDELEGDMALYSTFGDVASMSLEQATEAYEALRGRIMFNKFAWDDKRADIRHARRGVINTVVRALGKAKPNEYHRAKVNKKPTAKAKHMGDLMANAPQTLRALAKVPGLGAMAENIAARMNKAGEMMKTWERERWVRLEALSRHCLGKSWRKCMDELHQQQGTGVAYERKIWRSVSIRSDYLKELLRMSPAERAEEMKRNRAAGGVLADAVYSERDIEALAEEMAAHRDGGRVRKTIETRYVEEVQREENLELSKGEALYIILMHEQPTYTERMEAQGYTREVIAGLRGYVGQGWLDFGYGLREMFAEQGDKIAAVYEEVYGVPFPREENYFAARFVVDKVADNTAEGLLAGMTGQPGVGTGWMKPRVLILIKVIRIQPLYNIFEDR